MAEPRRSLGRVLRILPRRALQRVQAATSLLAGPPYTRLSIQRDLAGWVLDQEGLELHRIATGLGLRAALDRGVARGAAQCCHYTSQFVLNLDRVLSGTRNRVSVDYFHGRPGTGPEFDRVYEGLRRHHDTLTRVRVSHTEMEELAKGSGIAPEKVHRIPIGVNLSYFAVQTPERRAAARSALGVPASAVVVGSFQKDGVGWDEGNEPKLVKGPDTLVKVLAALKARVPELHVLLTGAARGYVMKGLEAAKVPYRHVRIADYPDIAPCFHALDAYLVTSRQEGGPKALMEAMASGVPVVTTRVGQAMDLVRHGENGWSAAVDDVDALVDLTARALADATGRPALVAAARDTAEANSYEAQRPAWAAFFRGYVEGW